MSPAAGHDIEPKREGTDRRNGDKEGRASLLPVDTDSQIPFSCKVTTNRILPPRAATASKSPPRTPDFRKRIWDFSSDLALCYSQIDSRSI